MTTNNQFLLESNIREIIHQILDPFQNRISYISQSMNKLEETLNHHTMTISQNTQQNIQIKNQNTLQMKSIQELWNKCSQIEQEHADQNSTLNQSHQSLREEMTLLSEEFLIKTSTITKASQLANKLQMDTTYLQNQIDLNLEIITNKLNKQYSEFLSDLHTQKENTTSMQEKITFLAIQQQEQSLIIQQFSNSLQTMNSLKEQKEIINQQFLELVDITVTKEQFDSFWKKHYEQIQQEFYKLTSKISQHSSTVMQDKQQLLELIQNIQLDKKYISAQINDFQHQIKQQNIQLEQQTLIIQKNFEQFKENEILKAQLWDDSFKQITQKVEDSKQDYVVIKSNFKKQIIKYKDLFDSICTQQFQQQTSQMDAFLIEQKNQVEIYLDKKYQELMNLVNQQSQYKGINQQSQIDQDQLKTIQQNLDDCKLKLNTIQNLYQLNSNQTEEIDSEVKRLQGLVKKQQERLEFFIIQTKSYIKKHLEQDQDTDKSKVNNVNQDNQQQITNIQNQQHQQEQLVEQQLELQKSQLKSQLQQQTKKIDKIEQQMSIPEDYKIAIYQQVNQLNSLVQESIKLNETNKINIQRQQETHNTSILKLRSDHFTEVNFLNAQMSNIMKFKESQAINNQEIKKSLQDLKQQLHLLLIITLHNELLVSDYSEQVVIHNSNNRYEYTPGLEDDKTHLSYCHQRQAKITLLLQILSGNSKIIKEGDRKILQSQQTVRKTNELQTVNKIKYKESNRLSCRQQMTVALSQKIIHRKQKTNSESVRQNALELSSNKRMHTQGDSPVSMSLKKSRMMINC